MPVSKSTPSTGGYFPDATSNPQAITRPSLEQLSSGHVASSGPINTGGRTMETLMRRASLGSRSVSSAPAAAGNIEIMKRGQIHMLPSLYHKQKNIPPTRNSLKNYIDTYEMPYHTEILTKLLVLPENEELLAELKQGRGRHMKVLQKKIALKLKEEAEEGTGGVDYNVVLEDLEELVTILNSTMNGLSKLPDLYDPVGPRTWPSEAAALTAVQAMFTGAEAITPDDPTLPKIPTINFSTIQKEFPASLFRLIRDIHVSQILGTVFDERTETEIKNKKINSKIAGALRSVHLNDARTLPSLINFDVPAAAKPLHDHYKDSSRFPNNLESPTTPISSASSMIPKSAAARTSPSRSRKNSLAAATGGGQRTSAGASMGRPRKDSVQSIRSLPPSPLGWAEYTGTGIQDDKHFSKIVLAYKDGDMFLTLSHYGFYKFNEDDTYKNLGQRYTPESGVQSPWMKIDMDR